MAIVTWQGFCTHGVGMCYCTFVAIHSGSFVGLTCMVGTYVIPITYRPTGIPLLKNLCMIRELGSDGEVNANARRP